MTSKGKFRFWSAWLISGLAAALLWYEPLLNSFWGSLAGIFIFGFLFSLPLSWFLTRISKKSWAGDWHKIGVAVAISTAAFFVFYASFSVHKHENYMTGYDLAIFDQAVWHLSRFEVPQSSVRNVPVIFGDHFDPIIALLVPVYGLFADPRTLLVLQAFLLVFGTAVIFFLCRREKIAPFLALLLVFFYLTHPGIQGAANCDFHEIAFAPLLMLAVFYFISKKKWRLYFATVGLLLLVKEEFALWVAVLGGFLILKDKNTRIGVATAVLGIIYFLTVINLLIPALNTAGAGYSYSNLFPGFESGFGAGVARYAFDPGSLFGILAANPDKWWSVILYVLPLSVPLFFDACGLILFLPAVATRALSSYEMLSYAGFYYNVVFAPLAVIVFIRFFTSNGFAAWRSKVKQAFLGLNVDFHIWAVALALSINLFYSYGYSYLLDPEYNWRSVANPYKAQMVGLVGQIPNDAKVAASYFLLPQLSQRDNLYTLPRISDAEFVIFDYCRSEGCNYWPMGSKNMPQVRDFLVKNPLYRIKAENEAGVLFERVGQIDEPARIELDAFCQKIIDQSDLKPVHYKYMSVNCGN